ncbi:HAD domain-containing protein [Actinophytocola algeriensis]|uniref:Secreted protein n=1 Tax=Actinophytocola algeriensis TaxID=1768010 RepID=A0A7W7VFB2_9PSEU|nr:HAD domain-containing protein [Actinophytocola algeriensis]MBB4907830.1 hypothetical protein [Actinophytocola algeriensis]MBE1479860.1 hypothetical protein [Actinophytocola algeriensis]
MTRPLLFIDVDGTLLPFGGAVHTFCDDPNPLLARLDPAHGPRLAALPCELVWATTWMADANDVLAPRLGLPLLPVVDWPEPSDMDEQDERAGLHWKTRALVDWAAGRPFAWVDDEITRVDRAWAEEHHPGAALLHRVDPREGLIDAGYATLGEWARRHR